MTDHLVGVLGCGLDQPLRRRGCEICHWARGRLCRCVEVLEIARGRVEALPIRQAWEWCRGIYLRRRSP